MRTVFATEATTRTWARARRPVAVPVARPIVESLVRLRDAVSVAITGGDGDLIVTSYLDLVRAQVDGRQLRAAAVELEHGLDQLRALAPATASPVAIWRLQLCLAALLSGLGESARARRAADLGHADAVHAGSELGQDRAAALRARLDLDRLDRVGAVHAAIERAPIDPEDPRGADRLLLVAASTCRT